MPKNHVTVLSDGPDTTSGIAEALASTLIAGDTILLWGEVGAGKTHFARALIQSLLIEPEDVPSPTFTLVQTYVGHSGEIWHSDLYRLSDLSEIEELGLSAAFEEAICLVEWPERLGDTVPQNALSLTIRPGETENDRELRFDWSSDGWQARLEGIIHV